MAASSKTGLVVSAHPGDFVWRAGGAIALHARRGYRVKIVCLSYGERGESQFAWKAAGVKMEGVKAQRIATDLPADTESRDRILLGALGSPDPRQIDGIGGAHPLTSKVAIVSRSTEPGIDIDFLFAQVVVDKASVDTTPNCGNILSGVAPFAIERGLVRLSIPPRGSASARSMGPSPIYWCRPRTAS